MKFQSKKAGDPRVKIKQRRPLLPSSWPHRQPTSPWAILPFHLKIKGWERHFLGLIIVWRVVEVMAPVVAEIHYGCRAAEVDKLLAVQDGVPTAIAGHVIRAIVGGAGGRVSHKAVRMPRVRQKVGASLGSRCKIINDYVVAAGLHDSGIGGDTLSDIIAAGRQKARVELVLRVSQVGGG